jgi:hypothetical protein
MILASNILGISKYIENAISCTDIAKFQMGPFGAVNHPYDGRIILLQLEQSA